MTVISSMPSFGCERRGLFSEGRELEHAIKS